MIKKGSLVRYKGPDKRLWNGKLLFIAETNGDRLTAYFERKPNGKYSTITIPLKDVEEVVA